ncbi:MAG: RNA polymerase sigma-70 factor (ECF subfamily) [Myxococcota bacterium]|jgi:RNA polymerase sigma-70 factor (ECF subfamily)
MCATALTSKLERRCDRDERAGLGFRLPRAAFAAWLQRAVAPPERAYDADDALLAELYTACGCSLGDASALARFEAEYLSAVAPTVGHMGLPAATVDDVRQIVRQKVLVAAPGEAPKIDAYAGRGKLRGLVQVVASPAALDLIHKQRRAVGGEDDARSRLPSLEHDPELVFLKATYRAHFAHAARELSSRQRNLLRMHLLQGVTLHRLAAFDGVHRASVTRWLAAAREALFEGTQRQLRARLGGGAGELESVMRLIRSRLDVSIQRMLRSDDSHDTAAPED